MAACDTRDGHVDKHWTNGGVYYNHNSHLADEFLLRIPGRNLADCRHCSTPDLLNNKFWILSNMKSPLLSSPDVVWRLLCNCVAQDAPDNVCADLCNNNCAKVYHNSHNWRKHFTRIFFKSIYSSSVSCISNLGSDRKSLCRTLQNFAKCLQILSNVHSSRNTSVINLSPRMCNSMIMFLALATHDCQKDQMIFGDLDSHLMKR